MKRILGLALAVVLTLSLCAGALADGSLDAIKGKGTFILGLDDSFPPMGYRNEDNEIVGFDIDLAKEVAARLGVELVLQPIDWEAKELELGAGNIDCIWNGMSRTPEREESMALSLDYMNNKMVFMTNNPAYQAKEDLASKVVAVQAGSYAEKLLNGKQHEEFASSLQEVRTYPDYLTAIMDMRNGNVDAILIDLVVANYQMANLEDDSLFTMDNLEDDLYCIGFRKDDVELRDAVDAILKDMAKEGKVQEIATSWFGQDIAIIPVE